MPQRQHGAGQRSLVLHDCRGICDGLRPGGKTGELQLGLRHCGRRDGAPDQDAQEAKVHVGLCAHTLDLVVATAPKFDMLLGVDFLDSSGATIHNVKEASSAIGNDGGTLMTQPAPISVGTGPG